MGVAVSNWKLAKAVSKTGQLGVVSGTMIDTVLARRLQDGDKEGNIRRALSKFPDQTMANKVLNKFFIEDGKAQDKPYKNVPLHKVQLSKDSTELIIVANFVEVFLAKENHDGLVGINYLEKIQLPTLPSIYGALLAGVDYILMGAGIPRTIPGIIDSLVAREKTYMKLDVKNLNSSESHFSIFEPNNFPKLEELKLRRPKFIAIISSNLLAKVLVAKSTGKVDGFVIENYQAGGHNAPPRGGTKLDERNEPIYGTRDQVDLDAIKELNTPFWLAGSYGNEGKLQEALELGAKRYSNWNTLCLLRRSWIC